MKKILNLLFLSLLLSNIISCSQNKTSKSDADMDRFVDDLMSKMTLEEKLGQMTQLVVGFDTTGPVMSKDVEEKIKAGLAGSVLGIYTPEAIRKLQKIAVDNSRLKIPLLFGYDVIHGHRTIFPINLGLAASWDLDLIERTARAAAEEASADGLNWTFSPMVDITRDPRWGRVSEGAGEDAYLGSRIAEAMVKGYEQNDLSKDNTILSCVKHFGLYGASEAGRDYNTVDMSRLRMYNEYLPPYKAAVEAGSSTVMTSFNEVEGMPASGNKWMMTDLLRNEWGFGGFIVTDYTAIPEMVNHGVGDSSKVTELSLNAGVDMDMVGEMFLKFGAELVQSGRVSGKMINDACRRILEAKYKLGLFENPYRYIDENRPKERSFTPEKLALSKEAAVKSMVLLKNDGDILPLDPTRKIAFIGPQVERKRDLIGSWSAAGDWTQAVSLREGLEKKFGKNKFLYAQGANLLEDTALVKKLNDFGSLIEISNKSPRQLIQEAVQTAQRADVVVAVLGEAFSMSGEAACRTDIGLPENQKELLKALKETGKPIVLVLMTGRPLTLTWENDNMNAILETWFAGTRAGDALTDILFGDVSPSGKITMTFPRNVGQIPIYYNHKNTGRPVNENEKYTSKYLDVSNEPLYPFGYGLSYTEFTYGDIRLSADKLVPGGKITATITVANAGKRAGTETVQLYIRDVVGSVTRPVKELKGFKQITLQPGKSGSVSFEISDNDLKFYNADLKYVVEPGDFTVFIGGNSRDVKQADFRME
ncbi:MAG: beta-glucosidase BglX [Candidatus Azobacteroides sp.]|nr:beta-glucosidase BglX [Candidatus Azobacteroides sp.]